LTVWFVVKSTAFFEMGSFASDTSKAASQASRQDTGLAIHVLSQPNKGSGWKLVSEQDKLKDSDPQWDRNVSVNTILGFHNLTACYIDQWECVSFFTPASSNTE